jgi:hypothetical protein
VETSKVERQREVDVESWGLLYREERGGLGCGAFVVPIV